MSFAKVGYQYQAEHHTVTIAATGTQLISCLAKKFFQQNILLNSFMKLGPGLLGIDVLLVPTWYSRILLRNHSENQVVRTCDIYCDSHIC